MARYKASTQTWEPVGQGFNGEVVALELGPDGTIYAGGTFVTCGATTVNRIARFPPNGTDWLAMGSTGFDSTVRSLLFHNGLLYIGGQF